MNTTFTMLSITDVLRAGLKRHFKAARLGGIKIAGSGLTVSFPATLLGHEFTVTLTSATLPPEGEGRTGSTRS